MVDESPTRRRYFPGRRRAENHEAAHAVEPEPSPDLGKAAHPLIFRGQPTLVSDDDALRRLVGQLRSAGAFAYDSEFIGELTYTPKLCLIQTATASQITLIDPLEDIDLRPFWELLCDPAVEKIVHAGQQDVEPVIRGIGREPANLLDTQIAAGMAGMTYPAALNKLVGDLLQVRMGKGLTFTHWDQRPLSAMQMRYAADDVRYLPALRAELGKRLAAAGHEAWVAEECAGMCRSELYGFDPDSNYLRVRGFGSLGPRGLAILRELTIWRNDAAKAADVPPRSFVKDEVLVDLARNPVRQVEQLDRVRHLPRPVEQEHGAAILAAIARGQAVPAQQLPASRQIDESPVCRFRLESLWAAAHAVCHARGIDPNLVTSRQDVADLYGLVTRAQDPSPHRLMQGWRREAVGRVLVSLLRGQEWVTLGWSDPGGLAIAGLAAEPGVSG